MREARKFHIVTTTEGCATNLLENATYREHLHSSGLVNCKNAEEAEVIIVNTCGYTTERENYTQSVIQNLKERFPNKEIIVGGCLDRKSTRLNSSHVKISYAVFCLKKKRQDIL